MVFVDTNYFLRFLLKDNAVQSDQAIKLFQKASENKVKLGTSVIVFFEIYWVLKSFYKKDNLYISNVLQQLLKLDFINYENHEILHSAVNNIDFYNYDLEDAYNCLYAQSLKFKTFKTFDQKLKNKYKNICPPLIRGVPKGGGVCCKA